MKGKTALIGLFVCVAVLFASCSKRTPERLAMQKADSLMSGRPDSSLRLLNNIPFQKLTKKSDLAYYALLKTEADDKNYLPHTDTALIRRAVDYYDHKRSERLHASLSWFYLGRTNQDMGRTAAAIEAYLKAIERMPGNTKAHDKMTVYNNLEDCYEEKGLYREAEALSRRSYETASGGNKKEERFYGLEKIGRIKMHLFQYDSALFYYKEALPIAEAKNDSAWLGSVWFDLAQYYKFQHRLPQAYQAINQSIKYSTVNILSNYSVEADILISMKKYEAARNLLEKSIRSNSIYVRATSAINLSKIERIEGKKEKALYYRDLYIRLSDSIDNENERDSVLALVSRHQLMQEEKKNERSNEWKFLLMGTGIIVLILAILFASLYYKKKYREWKRKLRAFLRKTLQEYNTKNKEREIKDSEIQALNRKNRTLYSNVQSLSRELQQFKRSDAYRLLAELDYEGKYQDQSELIDKIKSAIKKTFHVSDWLSSDEEHEFPKKDDFYYIIFKALKIEEPRIRFLLGNVTEGSLKQRRHRIRQEIGDTFYTLIFHSLDNNSSSKKKIVPKRGNM